MVKYTIRWINDYVASKYFVGGLNHGEYITAYRLVSYMGNVYHSQGANNDKFLSALDLGDAESRNTCCE